MNNVNEREASASCGTACARLAHPSALPTRTLLTRTASVPIAWQQAHVARVVRSARTRAPFAHARIARSPQSDEAIRLFREAKKQRQQNNLVQQQPQHTHAPPARGPLQPVAVSGSKKRAASQADLDDPPSAKKTTPAEKPAHALPAGFFDDGALDRKLRGVEAEEDAKAEEALAQLQRDLRAIEAKQADRTLADDSARHVGNTADEAVLTEHFKLKAKQLADSVAAASAAKAAAKAAIAAPGASAGQQDNEDDEGDEGIDPLSTANLFDWRSRTGTAASSSGAKPRVA